MTRVATTLTTTETITFDDDTRIRNDSIYYNIINTLLGLVVGGIDREEEPIVLEYEVGITVRKKIILQ